MQLICYKKCSTCNKLEKRIKELNIEYTYREIDKDNPTLDELKKWLKMSNLDIKKFFNTSGTIYKNMNLKEKLKDMTEDEKLKILSQDGMLVKRPIIIDNDNVYVGPMTSKYIDEIEGEK